MAHLCNKLAGLKSISTNIKVDMKPSFMNTRVYNCPGKNNSNKESNNRFLIESDVILKEVRKNEEGSKENIICKGMIIPNKLEHGEIINALIGGDRSCFNKNCIYRELCDPKCDPDKDPTHESNSNNANSPETAIAKLYVCSDHYDTPGSAAHTLNNLIFDTTEIGEKQNAVILDLTCIRSYYCFNSEIHKKELYGNVVEIKKDERNNFFKESNISYALICPVTAKEKWNQYGVELSSFLNSLSKKVLKKEPYKPQKEEELNNIKITKDSHHAGQKCPGTCYIGKRDREIKRLLSSQKDFP